jgi:hypothetical protein
VVTGAELSRWRSSWGEAAEAQWVAAGQGKYKESAAQFLVSTWQGDALMVGRAMQPFAWACSCVMAALSAQPSAVGMPWGEGCMLGWQPACLLCLCLLV